MKKERKDGLFLDNTVYIADEKKPGFPIQARMIQFIAILIGSWSSIGVLMESIAVPADLLLVNLAILLCAVIVYSLCLIPNLDLVKLFFGLLFYGLFLFSRLQPLQNGFYILENMVLVRLEAYYEFQTVDYIANYTTAVTDSTLLIIMIAIPFVTLLTIAIVRNRLTGIAGIVLFLPVTISFIFGLIPSERYLIAYLAAVLYLSRSGYNNHKITDNDQKVIYHRINSKAAVWLSMISLIIFFLLKLFITEEKYESIHQIKDTKVELQTAMFNFSLEDLTNNFSNLHLFSGTPTGGLEGGELGNVGEVKFTESEQLIVTADPEVFTPILYLKGYVGSDYTGDNWEGHSKKIEKEYKALMDTISDEFNPVNQVSQMVKIGGSINMSGYLFNLTLKELSIEYNKANKKFIYAPYFTDYESLNNVKYIQDLYAAPQKKKGNYTLPFYDQKGNMVSFRSLDDLTRQRVKSFQDQEELYRSFVYEVYTSLPDEGLERLKSDFSAYSGTLNEKVSKVMNYLNQNTTYSLTPGKLPKGKDFVEYFMYENKKGYCAHYASAATLMLRSMGIPARYVEGYVISPSDVTRNTIKASDQEMDESGADNEKEIKVSVKDYNAHAWVEIYVDNVGWIPVDFTPGSGSGYDTLVQAGQASESNSNLTPTSAPVKPNEEKQEPKEEKPDTPEKDTDTAQSGNSNTNRTSAERLQADQQLFILLAVLLLLGMGFMITVYLLRRRVLLTTKNRNKRAILLFVRMEKILSSCQALGKKGSRLEDSLEYVKEHCSYMNPDAFESCLEIVRKARFGKGKITVSELQEVEKLQRKLFARIYKDQSLGKKLYLKLLIKAGVI